MRGLLRLVVGYLVIVVRSTHILRLMLDLKTDSGPHSDNYQPSTNFYEGVVVVSVVVL
jgi:hypothetical protein